MKLVDPDGEDVDLNAMTNDEKINNRLVTKCIQQINAPLQGIKVSRNKETGVLSYKPTGDKLNKYDRLMKDILEDSKHFMHIEAIPNFWLYGFEVIGGALSSADAQKIKTENWYHILLKL